MHRLLRSSRSHQQPGSQPTVLIAGGTGVLGAEVLRRLAAGGRYAQTLVLAKEPMTAGARQVSIIEVAGDPMQWPLLAEHSSAPELKVSVGVVMFEPPRLHYQRERALWTPAPEQLLAVAQWLRRCGAHTLAVVVPHAQGSLPDAIKRGLANLDEQALAAIGFERLLLVRSAQKKTNPPAAGFLNKVAAWMLSTLSYMIPASEQPVRPGKLAEFIDLALHRLPEGTHVASPELLWRAAHGHDAGQDTSQVLQAWLNGATQPKPTL